MYGDLEEIPVYAKAGAIIPLGPKVTWGGIDNPAILNVHIFAGASNSFNLYEDDGETNGYKDGKFALTPISVNWSVNQGNVRVGPVNGDTTLIPAQRVYKLIIHGIKKPKSCEFQLNGAIHEVPVRYNDTTEMLDVDGVTLSPEMSYL